MVLLCFDLETSIIIVKLVDFHLKIKKFNFAYKSTIRGNRL